MRRNIRQIAVTVILSVSLLFIVSDQPFGQRLPNPAAQKTMPEVIILAKGSKAGQVTFNHTKHNSGDYTAGGPIACIECHHTAQPAAELTKSPPLKTAWPAGRTTTLTTELFAFDPKAAGVASCRDCHARPGKKPKLLPKIPSLSDPQTRKTTKLTSQLAFHQRCDTCHYQILFQSPGAKAPDVTNCTMCHRK
ncbi:MAG: cytochrome c3 family protein [Pyrinomonadaceae bacterium]